MFFDLFIAADVFAFQNVFFQKFDLVFQAGRQNCKSHYLDQTDVFFLDMVVLCVRMVNAERVLLCRNIIPKRQIQFVHTVFHSCNRSDGIMRLSVCLGKDKCRFICISSPCFQYMIRKVDQSLFILMTNSKYGKRPLHDSGLYIFITRDCHFLFNRCFCHGKRIMASLEMVVA